MKNISLFLLLFSITVYSCQKQAGEAEILQIAQSKEVGQWLLLSNKRLLDQRMLLKKHESLEKEHEILFKMNAFRQICDWDVSNSSPEIADMVRQECEESNLHKSLIEKYPILKDKETHSKMVHAALSQNKYYLESEVSDPAKYLYKNNQ